MSLPGFLIIGGMKCGSTTLYRDLAASPEIYFPLDKEPGNLTSDHVLTGAGLDEYQSLFERSTSNQVCGEASTNYTKRPVFEGVPDRAYKILGSELKIIYIIRHPLDRIESHMRHNTANGEWPPQPPETLLQAQRELVWFSSYGYQIEPWIDRFGESQVRVIRLDDYMQNRKERCATIWDWLGVEADPDMIDEGKTYNASASKPVLKGPFAWVPGNPVYKNIIRPIFSNSARDKIRHVLLPKNKVSDMKLGQESKWHIYESLTKEIKKLDQLDSACLLGPKVRWDDWFSHGLAPREKTL